MTLIHLTKKILKKIINRPREIRRAVHAVAYNYGWQLDYIWYSFSDTYITELIEDAIACNPWITKKEEPPEPEEIKSVRRQMLNNRMKWIEENAGQHK